MNSDHSHCIRLARPPSPTSSTLAPSNSSPPSSPSHSSPLGAIVGGAVGGVVVILLLLGLGVYLYRRRSKNKVAAQMDVPPSLPSPDPMQEKMNDSRSVLHSPWSPPPPDANVSMLATLAPTRTMRLYVSVHITSVFRTDLMYPAEP